MAGVDWRILNADCFEAMRGIEAGSVSAVITDPPYFRVKPEKWDRAWTSEECFYEWAGAVMDEVRRVLAVNGSVYWFAGTRTAWGIEGELRKRFRVLNQIQWVKGDVSGNGRWSAQRKERLRAYFPQREVCFFAGQIEFESVRNGWDQKCEVLRAKVFEPLRAYLDGERLRAGVRTTEVMDWFSARGLPRYVVARHAFARSQWELPTLENYEHLRTMLNERDGGPYLRREYEDLRREYEDLRREYEDLRREYEDLRRPFFLTPDIPYTDVWTRFPTVGSYFGKHPCEKPVAMLRHIVEVSTRAGDLVLDPFCGSGTTGVACAELGRRFIGADSDPHWCDVAGRRINATMPEARNYTSILTARGACRMAQPSLF